MTPDRQYISIKCLEKACRELGLPFDYYDLHKNLIKIKTPKENLYFANSTTPFNSDSTRKITEDKFFTYQLTKNIVNNPKTISFFDPKAIEKFKQYKEFKSNKEVVDVILKEFNLPVIVKRNSGRQGENVFLCQTEEDITKALGQIFLKTSQKYDYIALAQEYIPHEKEYRAIFFKEELILLYEKIREIKDFTGNLSPLHFKNSYTKEITDPDTLKKVKDFISPIFKNIPINFAGFDILKTKSGKLILLEINTRPGFDFFVRDHSEERLVNMYKEILTNL